MNEESVQGVFDYFRDAKESQARKQHQVMQFNPDMLVETLQRDRAARMQAEAAEQVHEQRIEGRVIHLSEDVRVERMQATYHIEEQADEF